MVHTDKFKVFEASNFPSILTWDGSAKAESAVVIAFSCTSENVSVLVLTDSQKFVVMGALNAVVEFRSDFVHVSDDIARLPDLIFAEFVTGFLCLVSFFGLVDLFSLVDLLLEFSGFLGLVSSFFLVNLLFELVSGLGKRFGDVHEVLQFRERTNLESS